MKILIVTGIYPPEIGGPATYSQLLFEGLSKYDIDSDLVVFSDLKKYPRVIRHILFVFKVLRKSKGADLYYAQDPVSVGLPTMVASFLSRKKYLLKIVGDYAWEQGCQKSGVTDSLDDFSVKSNGYGFFVSLLKKIQKTVASQAHRVIVPSNYLKKIVVNWGVSTDKISVVYNSFDFDKVLDDKEKLRIELGVTGKVVLSAGRLVPWKGFDTLIRVVGKMSGDIKDLSLIVIGDGPDREKLDNIIKENNIANVKLIGSVDQNTLFKYLKSADVFVLNTAYEGFSHQLLEVMAIGIPIITTNVGGNPELIEDGKNGLLVEYNNEKQLGDSIVKILNYKNLDGILVANGLQKVGTFSKDRMFAELVEILNDLKL